MTNDSHKARLAALVQELSVIHEKVTLASGRESDFYVDMRRSTLHHEAAPLIGHVMLDLLEEAGFAVGEEYVAVGGLTVSVLATPGHSEGSVTLRCGDVLFCGDTLFAGSCGRTDFPGGSMEKMMASLRRLGQLEGDLRVLPGHMEASTLDRERRWKPYLLQAMQ